jgi:hypothetical protein
MTDKELLELAAKAAGFKREDFVDGKSIIREVDGQPVYWPVYWNPLTDDGDALRLAVKLSLIVSREYTEVGKEAVVFYLNEIQHQMRCVVPHENNPYAATRRAIVRAAAEIGKAKCE